MNKELKNEIYQSITAVCVAMNIVVNLEPVSYTLSIILSL